MCSIFMKFTFSVMYYKQKYCKTLTHVLDMGKHDKQGWVDHVSAQGQEERESVSKVSYCSKANARRLI